MEGLPVVQPQITIGMFDLVRAHLHLGCVVACDSDSIVCCVDHGGPRDPLGGSDNLPSRTRTPLWPKAWTGKR